MYDCKNCFQFFFFYVVGCGGWNLVRNLDQLTLSDHYYYWTMHSLITKQLVRHVWFERSLLILKICFLADCENKK